MSSISDAIAKIRPDLNKQKRFHRGGEPGAAESRCTPSSTGVSAESEFEPGDGLFPSLSAEPRGWLGQPWLATTRSRVLASSLGAICLGIAVGYFPSLGRVEGRVESQPVPLAGTNTTLSQTTAGEIDAIASRQNETADAGTGATSDKTSTNPTPPAGPSEKYVLVPVRPKGGETAVSVPTPPPLVVQVQMRQSAAATTPSAPVAVAAAVSNSAGALPVPQVYPQVQEVLYEAMPQPTLSAVGLVPAERVRPATDAADAQAAKPAAPKPSDGITLSGIFWDKQQPMAMISGQIVEVGQKIMGAQILEINPDTVVLEQDGKRRSLRL